MTHPKSNPVVINFKIKMYLSAFHLEEQLHRLCRSVLIPSSYYVLLLTNIFSALTKISFSRDGNVDELRERLEAADSSTKVGWIKFSEISWFKNLIHLTKVNLPDFKHRDTPLHVAAGYSQDKKVDQNLNIWIRNFVCKTFFCGISGQCGDGPTPPRPRRQSHHI